MKPFALSISYLSNPLTGQWRKMEPLLIRASDENEASRTAIAIADFIEMEVSKQALIRVVDDDSGRPIAEIRRPKSD